MLNHKNISDALTKGAQVARNLILKNLTEEINSNAVLYFKGEITLKGISFHKENFQVDLAKSGSDPDVKVKETEAILMISPHYEGGKIITLLTNNGIYSLLQKNPEVISKQAFFPDPIYIKSIGEDTIYEELGH